MAADCSPTAPAPVTERATSVAHAWVRQPIFDELAYQARLLRLHPDVLCARILTAVLLTGRLNELLEEARVSLES